MNRSKIDWCDFSWNPITGCRHTCTYCYARKQAKRFCGDIRLNKASPQLGRENDLYVLDKPFHNVNGKVIPLPAGFEPTLHRYRLSMPQEKKLSANIFVGSMADIFGDWVPDEWIQAVFQVCAAAPWHRYLFLTKNPSRYMQLASKGLLPESNHMWYGSTVTTPDDTFWWSERHHTFVSIEPIMASFQQPGKPVSKVDWVIVGAETGKRKDKVIPEKAWIDSLLENCKATNIPLFMKRGEKLKNGAYFMEQLMGAQFIQEFPKGLEARRPPLPKHRTFVNSIRDKKACKHCGIDLQGKSAIRMAARYYLCPECLEEAECK